MSFNTARPLMTLENAQRFRFWRFGACSLLAGLATLGPAGCAGDDTGGTGGTGGTAAGMGGGAGIGGTAGSAGSGGTAGSAGSGGSGNPAAKCEETIATPPPCNAPALLLQNKAKCANIACHSTRAIAAHLDLASPCVARRLIGVMSDPTEDCAGHVLVEAANPQGSLFVQKLSPTPICGEQMPNTTPKLTADEQTCLTNWISWLAQNQ